MANINKINLNGQNLDITFDVSSHIHEFTYEYTLSTIAANSGANVTPTNGLPTGATVVGVIKSGPSNDSIIMTQFDGDTGTMHFRNTTGSSVQTGAVMVVAYYL